MQKIGFIFASQALLNARSRLPFGHLNDKVANRIIPGFFGLLAYSAALAGAGLSGRLVPFLLCSEAMGMSMGVAFTATGALICEVVPVETRGLPMGGCITCICFDMMVSPATVGMLFREVGFRVGFLPAAFLTAFTACFFYLAFRNHYRQKDSAVLEAGWNREEVSSARPLVCNREGRQKWNPAAFSG